MFHTTFLAGLLAATQIATVTPLPEALPGQRMAELMVGFAPTCATVTRKLVSRPEIAAVHAARPLTAEAICDCAGTKFSADARLLRQLAGGDADFEARSRGEPLRSYFIARLAQSVFSCFAEQLDASLAEFELPQ